MSNKTIIGDLQCRLFQWQVYIRIYDVVVLTVYKENNNKSENTDL